MHATKDFSPAKSEPAKDRGRLAGAAPKAWERPAGKLPTSPEWGAAKPVGHGPSPTTYGLFKPINRLSPVPEQNDLGWLSLCGEGDDVSANGELCRIALIGEHDPDMASPDPFESDEDWLKLLSGHAGR